MYIIKELQNLQSDRTGYHNLSSSLKGAKIAASKNQFFQNTVLTIENENGVLLAFKKHGEKWVNCDNVLIKMFH